MLSRYYNLQRERKIWWMRFSANTSRYVIKPHIFSIKYTSENNLHKKVKSITIKATFPFGEIDMEEITLIPLWELDVPSEKNFKVCLIRSVINLELTSCALILDACYNRRENGNIIMMLNRKLAPYQILIASLHQENKIVDELAKHLEHVIAKIGLRLYGKFLHINNQSQLEKELIHCDCLGIPYILMVNNDSIKTGLIKLRSRDTTLFETIHISDIQNYISHIFKA
ncbi:DNA polymerase subunit gamma-2, mitochondrial [Cochliomyia hominivorax]